MFILSHQDCLSHFPLLVEFCLHFGPFVIIHHFGFHTVGSAQLNAGSNIWFIALLSLDRQASIPHSPWRLATVSFPTPPAQYTLSEMDKRRRMVVGIFRTSRTWGEANKPAADDLLMVPFSCLSALPDAFASHPNSQSQLPPSRSRLLRRMMFVVRYGHGGKSRDSFCSFRGKIDSIQFCLWTRSVNTRNRNSRGVTRTGRRFCWFARLVIVCIVCVIVYNC